MWPWTIKEYWLTLCLRRRQQVAFFLVFASGPALTSLRGRLTFTHKLKETLSAPKLLLAKVFYHINTMKLEQRANIYGLLLWAVASLPAMAS